LLCASQAAGFNRANALKFLIVGLFSKLSKITTTRGGGFKLFALEGALLLLSEVKDFFSSLN